MEHKKKKKKQMKRKGETSRPHYNTKVPTTVVR
jgi:hypothetical protein